MRVVARKILARANQRKNDRQARKDDRRRGEENVQVLGLQELFYGPYFCAEQNAKWYELTENVPNGPTLARMQKLARKHKMVLVVPIYEIEMAGVFYNTAAVFDADGTYLGKYRKHHIPHCHPGFWEKFYFTPGNAGYPVFETRHGRIGGLHLLRPPFP